MADSHANLEFDHKSFGEKISDSHYIYEGGDSKGTYGNCPDPSPHFFCELLADQDAKHQLLRRFSMIDALPRMVSVVRFTSNELSSCPQFQTTPQQKKELRYLGKSNPKPQGKKTKMKAGVVSTSEI